MEIEGEERELRENDKVIIYERERKKMEERGMNIKGEKNNIEILNEILLSARLFS